MGRATPPIGIDLPGGDLSVRLHVDRIGRFVQPYLDRAAEDLLKKTASPDSADRVRSAQFARAALQGVRRLLQSAEQVDLGASESGGWLSLAYALEMQPGSGSDLFVSPERARGLTDLARCLPAEYPAEYLVALDFEKWMDMVESVYEPLLLQSARDLSPEVRDRYVAAVRASFELLRQVDAQVLAAGGPGERGFDAVQVVRARDADALLAKWRQFLEQGALRGLGVEIEPQPPVQVEGTPVYGYRVKLDFDKIAAMKRQPQDAEGEKKLQRWLGGEGPILRLAAVDDKVVLVNNADAEVAHRVVAALKHRSGDLPSDLRADLAEARAPLCLWGRLDLHGLLVPILEMARLDSAGPEAKETLEKLRAAPPVSVSTYATCGENRWKGVLTMDAAALAELTKLVHELPKHERWR
jgi:hypothetical protein